MRERSPLRTPHRAARARRRIVRLARGVSFAAALAVAGRASDPQRAGLPAELEGASIACFWTFDGADAQGWQAEAQIDPVTVGGGLLRARTRGPDPALVGPPVFVAADEFPFVVLRARCDRAGVTQMYYARADREGFREDQMVTIPMRDAGEWRVHVVDLRGVGNWQGAITGLRLDPVSGLDEADATLEVDWIALCRTGARLSPLLPWWKDDARLVVGFENLGGSPVLDEVELSVGGVALGSVCLVGGGRGELEVDAGGLPEAIWLEARRAGERVWRGRMVRPEAPPRAAREVAAVDADQLEPRAEIAVGRAAATLAGGAREGVRLAPLATLVVAGPGREVTHYEFAPVGGEPQPDGAREYEEWVEDPELGALHLSTRVEGTDVRTALVASAPLAVLRFEGPRLRQDRPFTHAVLPGLEYLEAGEPSSRVEWTGPAESDRSTPEPHEITLPMLAFEYDREPAGAAARTGRAVPVEALAALADAGAGASAASGPDRPGATTAALIFDLAGERGPATSAEFFAGRGGPCHATAFLPAGRAHVAEDRRLAHTPLALAPLERLELETRFVLAPCTIEQLYERLWTRRAPEPPGLDWAASGDDRTGPGPREAIERIVATSMVAYTDTLYDPGTPGWKTHVAVGEVHAPRRSLAAVVLAESLRSGRPELARAIGLAPDSEIEDFVGGAEALVGAQKRRDASGSLERMGLDGGVPYDLTPEMARKIREFTAFHGLSEEDFGERGATNAGMIALFGKPLFEYAAATRDPAFVAAAVRALARMNSFTVPRGSQIWEIHMQMPDLYASALCVVANLWGHRMTGDEHYLDEAQRWAATGIPFFYFWEPERSRRVRSVHVFDGEGEGPVLADRDPSLFYADVRRQVAPYASIPVFGTSWYAVTWLGIPVQWCGLAWGNAVRELDRARPVPHLVRIADGAFRSAANQQCDASYLAGTLPDSWEISTATSRQPYIIPDRLLEYAYRVLDRPWVEGFQHRLLGGPWSHAVSRAGLGEPAREGATLALDARFFEGQRASAILVGSAPPAAVRVDGVEAREGDELPSATWLDWGDRGALVVRWRSGAEPARIEVVSR